MMVLIILGIWVLGSFALFGVLGLVNRDARQLHRAIDLHRKIISA
jgi:hypothetical protein